MRDDFQALISQLVEPGLPRMQARRGRGKRSTTAPIAQELLGSIGPSPQPAIATATVATATTTTATARSRATQKTTRSASTTTTATTTAATSTITTTATSTVSPADGDSFSLKEYFLEKLDAFAETVAGRVNGANMVFVYKKAHKAMSKYPGEFTCAEDTHIIAGIGPKLISKFKSAMEKDGIISINNNSNVDSNNNSNNENNDEQENSQSQKKRSSTKSSSRPYVPRYGSSAYAVIMALYYAHCLNGSSGSRVGKSEIVSIGQRFTTTALISSGSRGYSPINGMAALVERGYVDQYTRNGRTYSLSETGLLLARKIFEAAKRTNPNLVNDFPQEYIMDNDSQVVMNSSTAIDINEEEEEEDDADEVDDDEDEVGDEDSEDTASVISLSSESQDGVDLVGIRSSPILSTMNNNDINSTQPVRLMNRSVTAGAISRGGGGVISRPPLMPLPPSASVSTSFLNNNAVPRRPERMNSAISINSTISSSNVAGVESVRSLQFDSSTISIDHTWQKLRPGEYSIVLVLDSREVRTKSDRDFIKNNLVEAGVDVVIRQLSLGDIMWAARPVNNSNSNNNNNNNTLPGIGRLARSGSLGLDNNGNSITNERLYMLDYIIERKTYDDLTKSIRDGRYYEQRTRLSNSGVKHIQYLVEKCPLPTEPDQQAAMSRLSTAMASIQYTSGFYLHHTDSLKDSIAYLVRMNNQIKQIYQNKVIYAVPDMLLLDKCRLTNEQYTAMTNRLRSTVQPSQSSSVEFAMSLESFANRTLKTDDQTVNQVFTSMLLTTRGLGMERAIEISTKFGTPVKLMEELEQHDTAKKRQGVFTHSDNSTAGIKRGVGAVTGQRLADAWSSLPKQS
ncbi:hypothetical protein GQ42DRAFT_163834 [Ramicandelaber brevisporus]|nr:hypothetical protein GQ42DRAFT_163834 [Ramicandelaber brevisporus]